MSIYIPQVLLFGNGLNLACGGKSWAGLIDDINVRDDIPSFRESRLPMPMQAILATNNGIKSAMKKQGEKFRGQFEDVSQGDMMRQLLALRFDDILTTNYSYEMETAAAGSTKLTDAAISRMARCTEGRVEPRYLLHTYNEVKYEGRPNRLWHIHGESRKPDSMILGHYWYASQLTRMKALTDSRKNGYQEAEKEEKPFSCTSWLDSFILGDVYVLGFGFNLAEIDLWWLLNRKQREKANVGKVWFYEPADKNEYEKTQLLHLMGAEIEHLTFSLDGKSREETGEVYRQFYPAAIADISAKMQARHGEESVTQ